MKLQDYLLAIPGCKSLDEIVKLTNLAILDDEISSNDFGKINQKSQQAKTKYLPGYGERNTE